jgi:hypothetical protein
VRACFQKVLRLSAVLCSSPITRLGGLWYCRRRDWNDTKPPHCAVLVVGGEPKLKVGTALLFQASGLPTCTPEQEVVPVNLCVGSETLYQSLTQQGSMVLNNEFLVPLPRACTCCYSIVPLRNDIRQMPDNRCCSIGATSLVP